MQLLSAFSRPQTIPVGPATAPRKNLWILDSWRDLILGEAEGHYVAALRADPKLTVAYNNLGKVYLSQGQISQAIVQFSEALRLNPNYREAEENLRTAKASDQFLQQTHN
jgi:tetratricopeptide (TPR) repeat protein